MNETALLPLRNKRGEIVGHSLVDLEILPILQRYSWHLMTEGYAAAGYSRYDGKWKHVLLHRFILGLHTGDGKIGDHINRQRLDNRRSNLRVGSHSINNQNRSNPMRGIRRTPCGHWRVDMYPGNGRIHLGTFKTKEEALVEARSWRLKNYPFSEVDKECR